MKLGNAKMYNKYYAIVEIDGVLRNFVRTPDGYYNNTKLGCTDEREILVWERKKDALAWIEKHSYKGMSSKYEVVKLVNDRNTNYRWEVEKK